MWYLEKEVLISASHYLKGYEGKCSNLHGHNWRVVVYCKGSKLDEVGMLVDFVRVSEAVKSFDHRDLNSVLPSDENPTAENLAKRIYELVPFCWQVMVEETPGSRVYYREE